MKIDRVHFYVEDAKAWSHWFVNKLGFQAASDSHVSHTCTEVVKSGSVCFVLSSPLTSNSPVAKFLQQHPPGIADVTFCVEDLAAVMQRAIAHQVKILQPIQHQQGYKWAKIAAWGSLSHTLIERQGDKEELGDRGELGDTGDKGELGELGDKGDKGDKGYKEENHPLPITDYQLPITHNSEFFTSIDHIVLNVAAGDLERAVAWYENVLEFNSQQAFTIQTARSALHSRVMVSPSGCVQFPINQPASPNSQIQEFLDANRGPGIQHIALQTSNIVQAIAHFRSRGVSFLPVLATYYTQLQQRLEIPLSAAEFEEIARQQILIDWKETNPFALLLQTFTQPIFDQPTFFFELIERRLQAVGFGEGNFRALFEAIEREQIKRGTLQNE